MSGKNTFDTDKLRSSVVDRINMIFGSQFLTSLRIKTQLLKRLQRVIVVDGVTHSQ